MELSDTYHIFRTNFFFILILSDDIHNIEFQSQKVFDFNTYLKRSSFTNDFNNDRVSML